MKKLLILLSILSITACGGSGDGSSDPGVSWSPGIYLVTLTNDGDGSSDQLFMVTSSNEFIMFSEFFSLTGNVSGAVMTSGEEFTATLSSETSGSYTTSINAGTFEIANFGYYGRSSSLEKLNATWVGTLVGISGTSTWTLDGAGNIEMTSESGCSATGEYSTINANNNEYTVSFTVENCLTHNGVYTGFGFTHDSTFEDDAFYIAAVNKIDNTFISGALIK